MSDLIDRQEKIDWDTIAYLSDIRAKYDCNDEEERRYYRACSKAIDALRHMPSARKTGKWINHRNDDGHHIADCNLCGETMQWWDEDVPNFCPNCGADMRGEEDA